MSDEDINQILIDLHYLKAENESLKKELLKKEKTNMISINDDCDVTTNGVHALERRLYSSFFNKNECKSSSSNTKKKPEKKGNHANQNEISPNYQIHSFETLEKYQSISETKPNNNTKSYTPDDSFDRKEFTRIREELRLELKSIKDDIKAYKNRLENQELINEKFNKEIDKLGNNHKEMMEKFQEFEDEIVLINKIIKTIENKVESAKDDIMKHQTQNMEVVKKTITDTMKNLFRKQLLELRDDTLAI